MAKSTAAFLERLPNDIDHRRYITRIMNVSEAPDIKRIPLIGEVCLWHTMIRGHYTIFDIDLTMCRIDISIDNLFLKDVNGIYFGEILMNPTLSKIEMAEILQYICPQYKRAFIERVLGTVTDKSRYQIYGSSGDCTDLDHMLPILFHVIGEHDTAEKWAISVPDPDLNITYEDCWMLDYYILDYQIYGDCLHEFIKFVIEKNPNRDNLPHEFAICALVQSVRDEAVLEGYCAMASRFEYLSPHMLFQVDHDIPECIKNQPMLLTMYSQASTDDVIEVIKSYYADTGLFYHDEDNITFRDDVDVVCDVKNGELIGVSLSGSENHVYLPNINGVLITDYIHKQWEISPKMIMDMFGIDTSTIEKNVWIPSGVSSINIMKLDYGLHHIIIDDGTNNIYHVKRLRELVKRHVNHHKFLLLMLSRFMLTDLITITFQYYL